MTDRSHITVILDRTGSMDSIRDDVIGGFNAFLAEQQSAAASATFTLVQFDSQDPYEVLHAAKPIGEVTPLTREQYVPRASTPLYDAMGRGILDLESRIAAQPEAERPSRVIFVVVTDGAENASREFDRAAVTKLVDAKKAAGWDFVFLSADMEAFHDAVDIGVDYCASLAFQKSKRGNDAAWAAASSRVRARVTGEADRVAFDDGDRASSSG
ncbi:hypothetical protein [Silanimonas lenta]|uniref:hypothetical protein n=1 Tax=Silanimonas lenta TaxID=265429 RepID=UPI00048E8722|nr:hypothetical protein [Silanimonas lenta]